MLFQELVLEVVAPKPVWLMLLLFCNYCTAAVLVYYYDGDDGHHEKTPVNPPSSVFLKCKLLLELPQSVSDARLSSLLNDETPLEERLPEDT